MGTCMGLLRSSSARKMLCFTMLQTVSRQQMMELIGNALNEMACVAPEEFGQLSLCIPCAIEQGSDIRFLLSPETGEIGLLTDATRWVFFNLPRVSKGMHEIYFKCGVVTGLEDFMHRQRPWLRSSEAVTLDNFAPILSQQREDEKGEWPTSPGGQSHQTESTEASSKDDHILEVATSEASHSSVVVAPIVKPRLMQEPSLLASVTWLPPLQQLNRSLRELLAASLLAVLEPKYHSVIFGLASRWWEAIASVHAWHPNVNKAALSLVPITLLLFTARRRTIRRRIAA